LLARVGRTGFAVRMHGNWCPKMRNANGIRVADKRHQFRIAENPRKYDVVQSLLQQESGRRVLIIGEYLAQLQQIAELTSLSTVTGKTSKLSASVCTNSFALVIRADPRGLATLPSICPMPTC